MGIWWMMVVVLCAVSSISGTDYFAVREFPHDSQERMVDSVPDYQDLNDRYSDVVHRRLYTLFSLRKRSPTICVNGHGLNFMCNNQDAYDALNLGHESPGRRRRSATAQPDPDD